MVQNKPKAKNRRKRVDSRVTIGFDLLTYDRLQAIAEATNAPIAHVVREAVADYLVAKSPKRSV